ncbi:unnamed protein product, partial [Gadus morhua 'NCC']
MVAATLQTLWIALAQRQRKRTTKQDELVAYLQSADQERAGAPKQQEDFIKDALREMRVDQRDLLQQFTRMVDKMWSDDPVLAKRPTAIKDRAKAEASRSKFAYAQRATELKVEKARLELEKVRLDATLEALQTEKEMDAALIEAEILES